MGIILSSRRDQDKIIVETLLEHHELVQLKGEFDDVHIFSDRVADIQTNIACRGKNDATKYFLIPKNLRKDIDFGSKESVLCQRIDSADKIMFLYVVNRNQFQEMPLGMQKTISKRTARISASCPFQRDSPRIKEFSGE